MTPTPRVTLDCPKCGKPIASADRLRIPKEFLVKLPFLSTALRVIGLECAACYPISQ